MARPRLERFEVYVRVAVDGETLAMQVPDIHAADGKEALHHARALYGDLAEVRGIEAVKA